jgi:hypothetical protein
MKILAAVHALLVAVSLLSFEGGRGETTQTGTAARCFYPAVHVGYFLNCAIARREFHCTEETAHATRAGA